MTEAIFEFLGRIGFTHPLHPAMTHIPMGMVMTVGGGVLGPHVEDHLVGVEVLDAPGVSCGAYEVAAHD